MVLISISSGHKYPKRMLTFSFCHFFACFKVGDLATPLKGGQVLGLGD